MKRLIVACDSQLKITVAYVTSEKVQKELVQRLEDLGKSVLIWKEEDIQLISSVDLESMSFSR